MWELPKQHGIERRRRKWFPAFPDRPTRHPGPGADGPRHTIGYHTGEISGPGTLLCVACGTELHLHKTGRIPPCPKCHATQFKRANTRDTAGQ